MIYNNVYDIVLDNVFLRHPGLVPGVDVTLKLEAFNPGGSIKLKTAVALVESAEAEGRLTPATRLIESTSGNLGIALAVICAAKRYPLTLVTDPNTSVRSVRIMEGLGAQVVTVTTRDAEFGYLSTRIEYIRKQLADEPDLLWLNQYANAANAAAHHDRTARSIHTELGDVDALFVGVGTSGTLMGCVRYFSAHSPRTRVIGVDSAGSVTFGLPSAPRHLPGLGASRLPEIFVDDGSFEKVVVPEVDAVATCRRLVRDLGLLAGASTGAALTAVQRLAPTLPGGARVVAISPDMGDRYLDTLYSASWIAERYPG